VIEAGERVAFVGPSGCGKTTIMQLLQRFYKYDGEILLDDVNILDYDLKSYRGYFGIVNQEPNLFMGSLKENISINKESFGDREMI
jgi:ATP-binding cassette, subfamily B (MDR/TAP), member 1